MVSRTFRNLFAFFAFFYASLSLAEGVGTFDGGVESVEINLGTTMSEG